MPLTGDQLEVTAQAQQFLSEVAIDDMAPAQRQRVQAAVEPQPELHDAGDRHIPVAQATAAAQQAGQYHLQTVVQAQACLSWPRPA